MRMPLMISLLLAAVVLLMARNCNAMGIPSAHAQEENEVAPNVTPQEPIDVELTAPPSMVLLPPTSDAPGEGLSEGEEEETEERRRQKALMLVLPFNARNMSDALVRDLYTRAPVTRIVDDKVTVAPVEQDDRPRRPLLHAQVASAPAPKRRPPPPPTSATTTTTRTTTTAPPTTITTTTIAATTFTTPAPPPARIAVSAASAPSSAEGKFGASYSAGVQVPPPVRVKVQSSYNSAPSSQEEKFGTSYLANSQHPAPVRVKVRRPVVRKPVKHPLGGAPFTTTTTPSSQSPLVTEVTRPLHASFAVMEDDDPPRVLYMTPTPEQGPEVLSSQESVASNNSPHRYTSHYSANRLRPPLMEADPTKEGVALTGTPDSPVAAALAALGMQPDPAIAFSAANLAHATAQRLQSPQPTPLPTRSPTPSPSPEAEVSLGAAVAAPSLADDLQALLASWGLLPGASTPPPPPSGPVAAPDDVPPTVDPLSYASFKPLPPLPLGQPASAGAVRDSSALGGEMRDFLAAFGLVSDAERGRRQRGRNMKDGSWKPNPLDFPIDMLTEDHLEVLRNLGLLTEGRGGRRAARNMATSASKPSSESGPEDLRASATKEHVFNPAQHLAALKPTPDEVRRLNKLLDTFKKYTKEKGEPSAEEEDILTQEPDDTTTVDPFADTESSTSSFDLIAEESEMTTRFPDEREFESTTIGSPSEDIAATTSKTESILPLHKVVAPSPLDISELLLLLNATKNEVKRQEAANASSSASATASSDASSSSSSDTGASIDDLAASFGGSVDEEPSSTTPASGLYFLVDWNSFLEVGDPDGEKRVNVRIAPKVGDARRFLPVTVP